MATSRSSSLCLSNLVSRTTKKKELRRLRKWSSDGRGRSSDVRGSGALRSQLCRSIQLLHVSRRDEEVEHRSAPIGEEDRSTARRSPLRISKKKLTIKLQSSACVEVHLLHATRSIFCMRRGGPRRWSMEGGEVAEVEEVELGWAARRWSSKGRRRHRAPARSSSSGEIQADALSDEDQNLSDALNPLYLERVVLPAVTSRKTTLAGGRSDLQGGAAWKAEQPGRSSDLEGVAKSSTASEVISKPTLLSGEVQAGALSGEVQADALSGEDQDLPEHGIGERAERPAGRSGLEVRAAWRKASLMVTADRR